MGKNISDHITYSEATKSITALRLGIDNTPNEDQLDNMRKLALNIFEPLREGLGNKPINISIFYRSPELNKHIPNASTTSQHTATRGAAIDLDNDNMPSDWPTNKQIFNYIKDNLEFDQLIYEHGDIHNPDWVHVSYNEDNNRKQVLKFDGNNYYPYY